MHRRTSAISTPSSSTQNAVNNGNRLVLTPEFSGSSGRRTRCRCGSRSAAASAHGRTCSSTPPTRSSRRATTLVDALAAYDVNTHLTLRLNVYNLTDEIYIRNVNNNGGRYNPGTPRSAMVSVAVPVLSGVPMHAAQIPGRPDRRAGGARARAARRRRLGGRPGHGRATSRRAPRTTRSCPRAIRWRARARRHDPRRRCSATRCSSRRRCRCACSRRSSTAIRAARRSAITSTTRSVRSPARRTAHPHRSVGDAVPRRTRTSTTAASWWSRTPTASTAVKLPAGHMVLYPSTSLHNVTPGDARRARRVVLLDSEHGARRRPSARCCSTWTRPSSDLTATCPTIPSAVQLTGVYHNLLRRWAEV